MRTIFRHIKVILFLPLLLFPIYWSSPSYGASDTVKILLINSYNQQMPWVSEMLRGVSDVFQPEKNNYSLYIENMDSKQFHGDAYFDSFSKTLSVKYSTTKLDLIFCSDNNAYDLLRQRRDTLFPGVPVVFCGVNEFKQSQLEGLQNFTGVVEITSAKETVELALLLQPDISKVYVVNDYLKTGRLWTTQIDTSLKELAEEKKLTIEHSSNLSIDELLAKVAGVGRDTIVILGAFFSDRNGNVFRYEQIARLLSDASSVPVYGLVEFVIDEGLVGGHVISGYYQGYSMGQLGLNILIGTDPQVLPVQLKGINKPIVNDEQLIRFGLDTKNLPYGISTINKPFSFYEHFKREILVVSGFITALLITILALLLNTVRLRRAKKALLGNEEQFKQLADATWEAVIIHDNGVLLQVNHLFTEMFGYSSEEILGKNVLNQIFTKVSIADIRKRLEKNDLSYYEAEGAKKDGTVFPIEVRVRNIIFKSRDVRVAAIRDLTERKEMEQQLAQSQKIEAIGTLAGGIAHDFNNILSAIIGYSELLLLRHDKGSPTHNSVDKILKAGNRAKALIQQILTFANKSEQTEEPVQLTHIIDEAMKFLRPSIPSSIDIQIVLHSESYILGDPGKMHQIVMNLCTNGGKAMPNGGVLTVSLRDVFLDQSFVARFSNIEKGHFVKLSVEDNGVGISAENKTKIFDPFFTTRRNEEGTGLGLSVVHGIVAEAGGFITVESSLEGGTVFEVFLPVLPMAERNDIPEEEKKLLKGTETIMLVDDEADLVEVGRQTLESLGYRVKGYVDCMEAEMAFRANPATFDLVITDMTMPKMSGDAFAVRLLESRPNIPIIICTGYSETFTEEDADKIGIGKFLYKPVELMTLASSVREVLDHRRGRATGR